MGDLGSDAGQSTFSLGAKALGAILRLLEKLMDMWRDRYKRDLEKTNLKMAKTEMEKQKALEKIKYKQGFVNYEDLRKSGMELQPLGVYMSKEDMKKIAEICKRENVIISGMSDDTKVNDLGRKEYQLICKREDVGIVHQIFERLNDENHIEQINKRIAEIEAKGNKMTDQDKVDLAALQEQKATIQRSYCEKMNDQTAQNVIDKAVNGEVEQKLTLDQALNRLTGRSIDRDVITIVADANDPSKYIKCHGSQEMFHDKPYIKTEYHVYKDAQCVLKTHDGRFEGRPEGYWNQQKEAIQQAGEFSGTFLKFYSVVEFQKWAETAKKENVQELASMTKETEKNIPDIIKELEQQLDKNGAAMKDGNVVDKISGEPLKVTDSMSREEQTTVAESMVIGKQIANYQEIQDLSGKLALAEAEVQLAAEGTPERAEAEAALSNLQSRYDTATQTEQSLITERTEINAVQAEQIVRNSPERTMVNEDKEVTGTQSKEHSQTSLEHPDTRRDDRMDERDTKQKTMEQFNAEIQDRKAKDGAKGNDVKDHQALDLTKAAAKTTPSKGHER